MINLVIWSFLLALVPLMAGIIFAVSAALAHAFTGPFKIDGGK